MFNRMWVLSKYSVICHHSVTYLRTCPYYQVLDIDYLPLKKKTHISLSLNNMPGSLSLMHLKATVTTLINIHMCFVMRNQNWDQSPDAQRLLVSCISLKLHEFNERTILRLVLTFTFSESICLFILPQGLKNFIFLSNKTV